MDIWIWIMKQKKNHKICNCQQLNASINNDLNILLLSMNISYAIFFNGNILLPMLQQISTIKNNVNDWCLH